MLQHTKTYIDYTVGASKFVETVCGRSTYGYDINGLVAAQGRSQGLHSDHFSLMIKEKKPKTIFQLCVVKSELKLEFSAVLSVILTAGFSEEIA